jgi:hypothetical protein
MYVCIYASVELLIKTRRSTNVFSKEIKYIDMSDSESTEYFACLHLSESESESSEYFACLHLSESESSDDSLVCI